MFYKKYLETKNTYISQAGAFGAVNQPVIIRSIFGNPIFANVTDFYQYININVQGDCLFQKINSYDRNGFRIYFDYNTGHFVYYRTFRVFRAHDGNGIGFHTTLFFENINNINNIKDEIESMLGFFSINEYETTTLSQLFLYIQDNGIMHDLLFRLIYVEQDENLSLCFSFIYDYLQNLLNIHSSDEIFVRLLNDGLGFIESRQEQLLRIHQEQQLRIH